MLDFLRRYLDTQLEIESQPLNLTIYWMHQRSDSLSTSLTFVLDRRFRFQPAGVMQSADSE